MGNGRNVAWRVACSLGALLYWSAVALLVTVAVGRDPLELLRGGATVAQAIAGLVLLAGAIALYAAAARAAHRRIVPL